MKIIDMHVHVVTQEYRDFLEKHHALNEDVMPLPSFSEEKLLNFMKEGNIEYCLCSISSPHPYFEEDHENSLLIIRHLNEYLASLKAKYPDQIGFSAILPLPDVEASIQEAIYALDVLHADGIKIASNSRGLYLGDPKMDPLMEVLNQRKVILQIHPHKPEPIANTYASKTVPLFEFLVDTTRAILNMGGNQFFERYPKIKVIVPHCGSFLPMIVERGSGLLPLMNHLGVLDYPLDIKAMMKSLYFDIAGYSKFNYDLLCQYASIDHIVYGSDYPFTPQAAILKQLENTIQECDDHLEIFYNNAHQLLK